MFKKLLVIIVLLPFLANAQMDNLKNLSSDWVRTINRNAATSSADAVIFNPAGLVELGQGIHISIGNQTFIRHPKQEFNSFITKQDVEKAHKGYDIFVPNLYFAFVKNNWAISTGLYIAGGGGSADFEDGSVTTEKILGLTNLKIKGAVPTANLSKFSQEMKGEAFHLAIPLSFTYKFNDKFAASLGGKLIYGKKTNEATASLEYNVTSLNKNYELDVTQSGLGFGGIIGINYNPLKNLKFSLSYESIVKLKYKTEVKKDLPSPINLFKDKEELQRDFAPVLRFGTSFKPIDNLTLLSDINYYFQTQADWEYYTQDANGIINGTEFISKNVGDVFVIGLGADYQLNEKWLIGCGFAYTDYLYDDNNATYTKATGLYETIKDDNITIGLGFKYKINDIISVNASYSYTKYFEATITDQKMIKYEAYGYNPKITLNNWVSDIAFGISIKL